MVALVTASFTGLVTRKPFYYLPIYWVIGVVALLIGQVFGRAGAITFLNVGQVELGTGLVVNLGLIVALQYVTLWYNGKKS
ncbi:MAG: hypothetical protein JWO59_2347 [Chloroflexi bacterium]|jgi:hypothetical protein|nr:hypothetical protein [Chloroflexota bacterium]MDB5077812.1 hypothetical protein [Chloroflexota bacterium]